MNALSPSATSFPTAMDRPVLADRLYSLLGNLIFALVVIGYPLSAAVSQMLGVLTGEINVAFRAMVAAMAAGMIFWTVVRRALRIDILISVFLAIYIIRLWYDFSYSSFPAISRDIQFFIAVVLLPALAMANGRSWFDEKSALWLIALIGGLGAVLVAYTVTFLVDTNSLLVLSQGGRLSFELLNPISVGYHGLYVAGASLLLLLRSRRLTTLAVCAPAILLGLYLLITGGSRGPIVALLACLILVGSASASANLGYLVAAIIATGLVAAFGLPEVLSNRFSSVGTDASSLERLYYLQSAFDVMLEYPLTGYSYVEPVTGEYPHNLLLEAGMAIGVGGAAMMLWMLISMTIKARQVASSGQYLVPLVGVAGIVTGTFSGAIWGAGILFCSMILLRDLRDSQLVPQPAAMQNNRQMDVD
jgi:hypothetical protein